MAPSSLPVFQTYTGLEPCVDCACPSQTEPSSSSMVLQRKAASVQTPAVPMALPAAPNPPQAPAVPTQPRGEGKQSSQAAASCRGGFLLLSRAEVESSADGGGSPLAPLTLPVPVSLPGPAPTPSQKKKPGLLFRSGNNRCVHPAAA